MTDSVPMTPPRKPIVDFVIIGAMKSGTTTLHAWLDVHPAVAMASWKEPSFFSRDDQWGRGLDWYESLFEDTTATRGEASTSYTDPRYAATAAERMFEVAPSARLIYLVRDPVDRARSHYRHQVQRGREQRGLIEALADPSELYLRQSEYWACLEPYTQRFGADQLLVVRLEDLTADSTDAWETILDHLGLGRMARPTFERNVTASKRRYTWMMRKMWESGLLSAAGRLPRPVRKLGAGLLLRQDDRYEALLAGSNDPIPRSLTDPVWEDVARLEEWLQRSKPLWDAFSDS